MAITLDGPKLHIIVGKLYPEIDLPENPKEIPDMRLFRLEAIAIQAFKQGFDVAALEQKISEGRVKHNQPPFNVENSIQEEKQSASIFRDLGIELPEKTEHQAKLEEIISTLA